MTHHAYHALDSHIIGCTLWQAGYSSNKDLEDVAKKFVPTALRDYPYLAEHAQQHFAKSKPKDVREFDFGLDLILDGLEKILAIRPGRRARRGRPRATRRHRPSC